MLYLLIVSGILLDVDPSVFSNQFVQGSFIMRS